MAESVTLFEELQSTVDQLSVAEIEAERLPQLQGLIDYIVDRVQKVGSVDLNFICTHNSRRSHLAMVWAQTAATINGIVAHCHSGGTEAIAFFHRGVSALQESGFKVENVTPSPDPNNPIVLVRYGDEKSQPTPMQCFSKRYDHPDSPKKNFGAVMVCDNADKSCPTVQEGTKIPVKYVDPKKIDDTCLPDAQKIAHYKKRADQIGTEMLYVFRKVKEALAT